MRIIPGFLFFVLATAAVTGERIDTLQEVLAFHQKALGEPLQGIQLELLINEPAFSVSARYQASRDSGMRIDVYADEERVFSEGFDGVSSWQWPHGATEPTGVTEDGNAALRRGMVNNLYGLHERPALGYELCYEGYKTLDDVRYWQVTSTAPDGFSETFYINVETGLIDRKVEFSALHPDLDPAKRESLTLFSNYRWLGSRRFSFGSEKLDAQSGEPLSQVTIVSAIADPTLPADTFTARLL